MWASQDWCWCWWLSALTKLTIEFLSRFSITAPEWSFYFNIQHLYWHSFAFLISTCLISDLYKMDDLLVLDPVGRSFFLLISIILEIYITYNWTFWESGSIFQKINQPSFTWGDNEIQNTQITNKEDLLHNALHFYSFFLLKVDCLRTELELWLVCWQLWLWCSLSSVSSLSPAPTRTLVSSSGSLSLSLWLLLSEPMAPTGFTNIVRRVANLDSNSTRCRLGPKTLTSDSPLISHKQKGKQELLLARVNIIVLFFFQNYKWSLYCL